MEKVEGEKNNGVRSMKKTGKGNGNKNGIDKEKFGDGD